MNVKGEWIILKDLEIKIKRDAVYDNDNLII